MEPWAFGPVVNVISEVRPLSRPVPHRGALSLWRIEADVLDDVRTQLASAPAIVNDISHLPPPSKAPRVIPTRPRQPPHAGSAPHRPSSYSQPPPPKTHALPQAQPALKGAPTQMNLCTFLRQPPPPLPQGPPTPWLPLPLA